MTTVTVDAEVAPPAGGLPLGPESLTWQLFGDLRLPLIGPRAAVLQNMLPALGQGVEEHSVWFADTAARLARSIPPIMGTLYGDDGTGAATGHRVRDFHTAIKGRLPDGTPYSALNPYTYYWAHACFVESMVVATETFIRPLSRDEKDQIIGEHVTWYHRYGVSEPRDLPRCAGRIPRTWAEFEAYFDAMLDEQLVRHRTAAYGMGYTTKGWPRPRRVRPWVWAVVRGPINAMSSSLSIGGMPPRGREILGLPWDADRERRYRRVAAVARRMQPAVRRLPARLRMHPIAARAFAREAAR
ncbi:oxygenase MpaB family protein [Nocardioides terrisoli]|uniref:oxygenase MpaB family protein n=1 Tax=Nocardioides terrisoli TaxID=3388267 RepID=UPI00287B900B|nr:oxygenase MpaB family protein [Nocardioides marmorisolisilvae]